MVQILAKKLRLSNLIFMLHCFQVDTFPASILPVLIVPYFESPKESHMFHMEASFVLETVKILIAAV